MQRGVSVITTPVFTRIMTPAEYGASAVFFSWLEIAKTVITLYVFAEAYMLGLVKFGDTRNQFTSSMEGLCLTLILVWAAIYVLFRDFWNGLLSLTTVQMAAMFVIVWTSSVSAFWAAEQRIDYKYIRLSCAFLLTGILSPLFGIYLVLHSEDKVTARIVAFAAVDFIFYIWIFFAQMLRGRKFFSPGIWKYAILFNLPLLPHYLSDTVLKFSDRIMIEKMIGAQEAGIYSLAFAISVVTTIFNGAIYQSIQPWLYKTINERRIGDLSSVAVSSLILVASVNIALLLFVPEVVSFFAPQSYHNAIWVIPPLAMSVYFLYTFTLFTVFQFYYEKPYLVTAVTLFAALLNIILNYFFLGVFGYYAAGYTTLFCYIVFSVMHYYFTKKICKKYSGNARPYDTKAIIKVSSAFLALGFVILFTYNNTAMRYSLTALIFVTAFLRRKFIAGYVRELLRRKREG
ncbi:MAG: oligosaccharide flippase family protein [Synergistes sp.]|nr:oligosaccharide flippase family protein [Synergistes sp.]